MASANVSEHGYGRENGARNHLLEINLISAQQLHQRFRRMKTYAVAYAYPDDKQHTQPNRSGNTEPTWNEKFVIRVSGDFIRSETSAIMVTFFAVGNWTTFNRDPILGQTRILVSTFINRPRQNVALQIRRPKSLRPQGILNVAVTMLANRTSARSSFSKHRARLSNHHFNSSSRPSSMRYEGNQRIDEDIENAFMEQGLLVDKSGPLEKIKEQEQIERKNLESKIEQWKVELSPDRESSDNHKRKLIGMKMRRADSKKCSRGDTKVNKDGRIQIK